MTDVFARSIIAQSMWPDWCMMERLERGTRSMRHAGREYLPQWPAEDDQSYEARLRTSWLYNATGQTIESMSGRPFQVPVHINDDVPAPIKSCLDDVDLEGRNLDAFARDLFRVGLAYGHAFTLVDYPTTTGAAT